jgi:dihydropteroate synthase type 2
MNASTSILGIVNVTRDSFSDGGRFLDPQAALEQARRLVAQGADVIDLGAESTHPDAESVPAEVEIERLTPIVQALRADGVAISIDTYKPLVMRAMLDLGVQYINDVTGVRSAESAAVLRDADVRVIVMHSRSSAARAERRPVDPATIVDEILAFLRQRLDTLTDAGIDVGRLILDPGMGLFLGNDARASLTVLAELPRIVALGPPVLVSTSRKGFIGEVLGSGGASRPAAERLYGTLVTEILAVQRGVRCVCWRQSSRRARAVTRPSHKVCGTAVWAGRRSMHLSRLKEARPGRRRSAPTESRPAARCGPQRLRRPALLRPGAALSTFRAPSRRSRSGCR